MNKLKLPLLAVLAAMAVGQDAMAREQGDWMFRFGASLVDPKSNNHPIVDVDDAWSATFNLGYMMTDNWAIELLAAYPFEHDIYLKGTNTKVAETKHLPPTLSLQYHFTTQGRFKPYLGAGINYTTGTSSNSMTPRPCSVALSSERKRLTSFSSWF